jgi:hypothetical protein
LGTCFRGTCRYRAGHGRLAPPRAREARVRAELYPTAIGGLGAAQKRRPKYNNGPRGFQTARNWLPRSLLEEPEDPHSYDNAEENGDIEADGGSDRDREHPQI